MSSGIKRLKLIKGIKEGKSQKEINNSLKTK